MTKSQAKNELRTTYLQRRHEIPDKSARSLKICERISAYTVASAVGTVAIYHAFRGEVSLAPLARAAASAQLRFCAPRIDPNTAGQMKFFEDSPALQPATARPNRYGILEPLSDREVSAAAIDLLLIPCLGVSSTGFRLGYGGGYYDRFLPSCQRAIIMGVCFEDLLNCPLEPEGHDQRLGFCVHESGMISFS